MVFQHKRAYMVLGVLLLTVGLPGMTSVSLGQGGLWTSATRIDSLRKGPYLIFPGSNTQMKVLYQLNQTANCTLSWGTDTTYSLDNVVTREYGDDHQHAHTLTDLIPGTKYHYQVQVNGLQYTGSFRTAPPDGAMVLKFMVYGDCRTGTSIHDDVAGAMVATYTDDPDFQTFTLVSGDLVTYGAEESAWDDELFDASLTQLQDRMAHLPFHTCMGNHELYYVDYSGGDINATVFRKYLPYPFVEDRYWSFDYGPAHIVVVD